MQAAGLVDLRRRSFIMIRVNNVKRQRQRELQN